ncbi:MAG: hypothetical protein K6F69_07915 [Treponema sp.]|nr:hypothetical protein [Treponema sp.]
MSRSVLEAAQLLLRRRKFADAITMLESRRELYHGNFQFYLTMGIACLYVGDFGTANAYFQEARHIHENDVNLLLGFAVIHLRRGDVDRALGYYLDVIDNEPENSIAKNAMEFIRKHGDYDTICKWVDTGKIKMFYPPLGINPSLILGGGALACILAAFICLMVFFNQSNKNRVIGPRANLTHLELTSEQKQHAQETDLSSSNYRYILSNEQINKSYEMAKMYFQSNKDNAAQVEINRILNSNASFVIKQNARQLMSYLKSPTFDTFRDNYSHDDYDYNKVVEDVYLYLDCWVIWSGRVSNKTSLEGGSYGFDLLVGYEDLRNLKGIVPVYFKIAPQPEIDGDKSIRVLGKVTLDNGKLRLDAKSVYQPPMQKTTADNIAQ